MNPLLQRETTILPLLIGLALACFGLLPQAQAISPPPDGCYPNFTTAEGCDVLNVLTTGAGNTGLGWRSLFLDSTGSFNTGVGGGALALNNGDSNTAVGAAALLLNTTGTENTATGTDALVHNDTGSQNTAGGAFALFSNTIGSFNTANGEKALFSNATGSDNTAIGLESLLSNTTGSTNIAIGESALQENTDGNRNVAFGNAALGNNTTGHDNIASGFQAGLNQTTGSGNIYIGNFLTGVAGESNTCYIASISGQTSTNGIPVLINSSNKLGTLTSSKRFKEEIKPMERVSEALFSLKPVTFRYKKEIDPAGTPQLGLVAEDVEKVNPDLVVRDKEGKPYTVRYDQVNAMLLNEFLKEHHQVQDLKTIVAGQQKQIEALTAGLQKVSAQVEASKPAPHVVRNP
jgi:trimeric autotransporter adhesin